MDRTASNSSSTGVAIIVARDSDYAHAYPSASAAGRARAGGAGTETATNALALNGSIESSRTDERVRLRGEAIAGVPESWWNWARQRLPTAVIHVVVVHPKPRVKPHDQPTRRPRVKQRGCKDGPGLGYERGTNPLQITLVSRGSLG